MLDPSPDSRCSLSMTDSIRISAAAAIHVQFRCLPGLNDVFEFNVFFCVSLRSINGRRLCTKYLQAQSTFAQQPSDGFARNFTYNPLSMKLLATFCTTLFHPERLSSVVEHPTQAGGRLAPPTEDPPALGGVSTVGRSSVPGVCGAIHRRPWCVLPGRGAERPWAPPTGGDFFGYFIPMDQEDLGSNPDVVKMDLENSQKTEKTEFETFYHL